ncbi:MAG: hypothetical protein QOJ30_4332 [Pseudonocardiales bacterium]|jgi:hypothetical protein|nr:hypothetical protein [Pseudonocardiales bacterium]HEV7470794.1 hypothetical protein [Pseudonocardia sp.]
MSENTEKRDDDEGLVAEALRESTVTGAPGETNDETPPEPQATAFPGAGPEGRDDERKRERD